MSITSPAHCPNDNTRGNVIDIRPHANLAEVVRGEFAALHEAVPVGILDGVTFRRRRLSCSTCGHRWTTAEITVTDLADMLSEAWGDRPRSR